ncbi:MAG TPA: SRPBCC family protein [Pyrinomonadaceae bacterium]|nr:SRPBCC family protein [Pyrinomonadaceae bacterium]
MLFVKESRIRASPERVFAFHEQQNALELLLPPWESAQVIRSAKISEVGSRAIVETRIFGPITMRWIAEHTIYDPPRVFEDVQIKGPFSNWRHRHVILPHDEGAILKDEIEYEPPLGFLGRALAPLLIENRLSKLFEYRHQVTREWCENDKPEPEISSFSFS